MTSQIPSEAANSLEVWNDIWKTPEKRDWRELKLAKVYKRIAQLVPSNIRVMDLGGGVGALGAFIKKNRALDVTVCDFSPVALEQAKEKELEVLQCDLFKNLPSIADDQVVVSTEFIEHMPHESRDRLMFYISTNSTGEIRPALLSIPNFCLGPEDEAQHTIKWSAIQFKHYLEQFWDNVRVECIDHILLGVCGFPAKTFTLSVCTPVKDEEKDLERTLASFRGAADQLVVGVDPRTTDRSWEVAERYADIVFEIEEPEGPEDDRVPKGGVHFSWIRNQCIDRCTSDWIFMTEAHESLHKGLDVLLHLEQAPQGAKVAFVWRTGQGQRWGYPWLFRNHPEIRFKRSTHNQLQFSKEAMLIRLPQIETLHEREIDTAKRRLSQRKVQNKLMLMEDWRVNDNIDALYYLANEWRQEQKMHGKEKAQERLEQLLNLPPKNGALRYQARLILAKTYYEQGDLDRAEQVLLGCPTEDWSRTEHWLWLGDLAWTRKRYEEAHQFYLYSATRAGKPPFTVWWIDDAAYTYLPCQRLTVSCAELGLIDEALIWAEKAVNLLPEDVPEEFRDECKKVANQIREALADES